MKSILLVDDEPLVVSFITSIGKSLGYRIEAAKDGEEALWLYSLEPKIDGLITDVRMPGMDGFQLAKTLRVKHPKLPILVISGYFEKEAISKEAFDGRGTYYLAKPFTRDQLVKGLELLFT